MHLSELSHSQKSNYHPLEVLASSPSPLVFQRAQTPPGSGKVEYLRQDGKVAQRFQAGHGMEVFKSDFTELSLSGWVRAAPSSSGKTWLRAG